MQKKEDRRNYRGILGERTESYLVHLDWPKILYATYTQNRFSLAWRMSKRWANRHFALVCPWFYTPVLLHKGTDYPGREANQGGLNPQHCLSGSWIFCEIYVLFNKVVKERKEPSFSQIYLRLSPGSVAAGRCQHISWSLHRKLGSKFSLNCVRLADPAAIQAVCSSAAPGQLSSGFVSILTGSPQPGSFLLYSHPCLASHDLFTARTSVTEQTQSSPQPPQPWAVLPYLLVSGPWSTSACQPQDWRAASPSAVPSEPRESWSQQCWDWDPLHHPSTTTAEHTSAALWRLLPPFGTSCCTLTTPRSWTQSLLFHWHLLSTFFKAARQQKQHSAGTQDLWPGYACRSCYKLPDEVDPVRSSHSLP